jgi:archaeosortase B (VPXXXP-CTERM-specific)
VTEEGGPDRPWAERWRRHGPLVRAWLVFFAVIAGFQTLLERAGGRVEELAALGTAALTTGVLQLLGVEAHRHKKMVDVDASFLATIIFECTAVVPVMLWVAAVLAYPTGWRPKLLGLLIGIPILLGINLVRLVTLFIVGERWAAGFDFVHMQVWQSIMIFLTLLLWVVWAITFTRRDETRAP